MQREGVPGIQIALIRKGEIVLFESYGVSNIETKAPLTSETVFEAASLSKPVFAYLAMKLVEEGLLDLDAPLSMASASMVWREDYETRLTYGHKAGDDTKPEREMMKVAGAASSLVCNAEDYARFIAALVKPPDANETFLTTETIAQMFTPRIEAGPEVSWGLGWGLQLPKSGPVSFFQWGNNGDIYNAFVVGCPSTGEGAVVLTNSGKGLRVCRDLIPMAVSGDHPALRWNRVIGN